MAGLTYFENHQIENKNLELNVRIIQRKIWNINQQISQSSYHAEDTLSFNRVLVCMAIRVCSHLV